MDTAIATEVAENAHAAARNMLDLSGFEGIKTHCKVVTRRRIDGTPFHSVELAIMSHSDGDRLGTSKRDRAIKAAIAAASAEIDAPLYLEIFRAMPGRRHPF